MKRLLQRYRYSVILLRELVITDFKLRYQNSALGYLWSLLRPLATFVILYLIFVKFLPVGLTVPHKAIYLLLGIVLWNYFSEVTNNGVSSIVGKGDLLRKLDFPKYVIVLSGSLSALINLTINLFVVAVFMLVGHVGVNQHLLLAPLWIAELFIFALSLAFLLSSLFVKLRDMNYVWEVIMQGAFYATPIIYLVTRLPHKVAEVLMLNPVAQIIQDSRFAIITQKTPTIASLYGTALIRLVPLGIVLFFAVTGMYYFRKRSRYFAEDI